MVVYIQDYSNGRVVKPLARVEQAPQVLTPLTNIAKTRCSAPTVPVGLFTL